MQGITEKHKTWGLRGWHAVSEVPNALVRVHIRREFVPERQGLVAHELHALLQAAKEYTHIERFCVYVLAFIVIIRLTAQVLHTLSQVAQD